MAIKIPKGVVFPNEEQLNTDGQVKIPKGVIFPNQALQQKEIEEEMKEYFSVADPENPADLPTLPVEGEPKTQGGEGQGLLQDVKYRLSPITDPILEVMNAINSSVIGSAWDLAVGVPQVGIGAYNKATTGEFTYPPVKKPVALTNQTFVADPDAAEILDKGALYATMGLGMNLAAKQMVNNLGRNYAKNIIIKQTGTGVPLKTAKAQPFLGTEGITRGVVRDIASTPLSTEVGIGLAMVAAGQAGKAQDMKVLGVDLLTLPSELIGGIGAAASMAPKKAPAILNAFEKKFGKNPVFVASEKIRGKAVSPVEAKQALEASVGEEVLSVALRTEDSGLLTLERSIADTDPIFKARMDEGIDLAQASLADELSKLTDPTTGTYNWAAFKEMLPKIEQDLQRQVNDRVTAAQEELGFIVRTFKNDPVKTSKEFTKVFDEVMADLTVQEQRLWQPINDLVSVSTTGLREEVATIVQNANKAQNLPVAEMSEILGFGIQRTSKGWRVTNKKKEAAQPTVKMLDEEAPIVLTTLRSNLNQMRRASARATDSKDRYDQGVLFKLQEAILNSLTRNADAVNPELRDNYLAAIGFTKEMHNVTSGAFLMPKVIKAQPEKKVSTLLGGTGQEDIAIAAREMSELSALAPDTNATSNLLKKSEQFLYNKFADQVDATDLASFDLFIAKHQDWFKRFPEAGAVIKEARQKAKNQGIVVKDALKAKEAEKTREFYSIAQLNPNAVMDIILTSANPSQVSAQFRKLLSPSPVALQEFKDQIARRIAAESMQVVDKQIIGSGKQQVIETVLFEKALKKYAPLTGVFNTKELKGLKLLHDRSNLIARSIQAKGGIEHLEGQGTSLAMLLTAKVVALKAVSALAGSQSIVLANSASNAATKAVRSLTDDVANDILKEAYKNEELMKILLTENITPSQLSVLNSNKFQSGRVLFKALTEGISQDEE